MVAFQQTLPSNTCRMPNPGYHIFFKNVRLLHYSCCELTRGYINLYHRPSQRSPRATLTKLKIRKVSMAVVHYIHNVWEKGEKKETVLDQYKIRNTATDTVMQYELTRDELSHQFS